ncbi:MAG: DMT family transporter [Cytophagales bacterium]|nr:DMT family transporter [Cytophagales bacterium]
MAFWILGLVWGTNFIFMKWALVHLTPFQIVFFRLFLGFIPVLLYALVTRQLDLSHLKYIGHFLVMSNLAAAVYYYLFVKGTGLLPSGIAGAVSGAIPLFAFILSVIFIPEEKLTRRKATGILLGLLGVLIVARPFESHLSSETGEGVLYLILGSLSIGASFVYARRFITPLNIPSGALTTYQLGLASLLMLFVTDFSGVDQILTDHYALVGLVLGLGLLGTGLAFILYYYVVAQLGATTASSATYIPPVVALIIGVLLLDETITALDWLATGFIFAGVILLRKKT